MDFGQCFAQGPEMFSREKVSGKNLVQLLGVRIERRADDRAQRALRQALGKWVDGQHLPSGRRFVGIEPMHAGVDHFPAAAMQHRLARQKHFLAAREFFQHVCLIEPHRSQIKPTVAHQHAQHRSARTSIAQLGFFHHAANREQLVLLQFGNAAQVGQVLIIAREIKQQIGHGVQIEPMQQFRASRSHAFQILHRHVKRARRRG